MLVTRTLLCCSLTVVCGAGTVFGQTPSPTTYVLDVAASPVVSTWLPNVQARITAGLNAKADVHIDRSDPSQPPRVELLSLDRPSYEMGDAVIYQVLIENVGTTTLLIPWSRDANRVVPNASEWSAGSVFLEVRSADGKRLAWLASHQLYGSPSVDGTLQAVAPGESARLRVSGKWFASPDELTQVLAQPPGGAAVAAVLHLAANNLLVASTNVIPVALAPRTAH